MKQQSFLHCTLRYFEVIEGIHGATFTYFEQRISEHAIVCELWNCILIMELYMNYGYLRSKTSLFRDQTFKAIVSPIIHNQKIFFRKLFTCN